jgi:hypothetical protein
MSRGLANITSGMVGPGRDQQLLAWLRAMDLSLDLELHIAIEHDDQFVGAVDEILPTFARRVGPQLAAEPSGSPIGGNLFSIHNRWRHVVTPLLFRVA